ncbi:MAG: Fic family protein [Propionibacteriaceae bacterium]|nr:Fic family protein [Propionibacteriaceae bacterium]
MFRASSHPFISFEMKLDSLQSADWIKLGEAMSKCEHLSGIPLKPAAANHLSQIYLARGVHATTAIEGNTLPQETAEQLVAGEATGVPSSQHYLEQELKNVLEAVTIIDTALAEGRSLPIDTDFLCGMNELLLRDTEQPAHVRPGEIRTYPVGVNSYRAPESLDVEPLLNEFVNWLDRIRQPVDNSLETRFVAAVISAILAHLYLAWIHPFGNGNGRLARLIEVQILSESGVVPIVATNLLSNHYNMTREAYYRALDAARESPRAFIGYSLGGFVDGLRGQIDEVKRQSLVVHWESFVFEQFQNQPNTDARSRQRALALAMPDRPVSPEEAVELTPRLARLYAKTGDRTPARDLNALSKMGLVSRVGPRRYASNSQMIEAFIPPVASNQPPPPPIRDRGDQHQLF